MTYFLMLVCLLLGGALMLLLFKPVSISDAPATTRDLRIKKPLSPREQVMYFRLVEAVAPYECVVLSQVSFSALIDTDDPGTRNAFCRKYTDFVVCNTEFDVLVVVELDDASHRGREQEDAARESFLTEAGHRVIRFDDVPDVEELRMRLLSSQHTQR